MSDGTRKLRFGLWYDFRNPPQWRQSSDRLYREILDQIAWAENHGFDDVRLSEHHFIEDGYLPSILPVAAANARTNRIRIVSGVLLVPFHSVLDDPAWKARCRQWPASDGRAPPQSR